MASNGRQWLVIPGNILLQLEGEGDEVLDAEPFGAEVEDRVGGDGSRGSLASPFDRSRA